MRKLESSAFGAALCAAALLACSKGKPAGADAGTSVTPSAATASGGGGTTALLPAPPIEGWSEARTGDPLELARLADREGAQALAEVASNESATSDDRATAIRALAFVDDPSPAIEALTKLATDASIDRSTLALQTLAAVAPKRAPIEELEPGAWRGCADGLLSMLKTLQDPVRREIAIRALLALEDRGVVAHSAIPTR